MLWFQASFFSQITGELIFSILLKLILLLSTLQTILFSSSASQLHTNHQFSANSEGKLGWECEKGCPGVLPLSYHALSPGRHWMWWGKSNEVRRPSESKPATEMNSFSLHSKHTEENKPREQGEQSPTKTHACNIQRPQLPFQLASKRPRHPLRLNRSGLCLDRLETWARD